MVHKAILKRRPGIEVFDAGKQGRTQPKKERQVVAVKVLKGSL